MFYCNIQLIRKRHIFFNKISQIQINDTAVQNLHEWLYQIQLYNIESFMKLTQYYTTEVAISNKTPQRT